MQETYEMWIRSLGGEDPLEEGMATHSSILAWRIPWTEEPGGLQPVGSQRVGLKWLSTHIREGHLYLSLWVCGVLHSDSPLTFKPVRSAQGSVAPGRVGGREEAGVGRGVSGRKECGASFHGEHRSCEIRDWKLLTEEQVRGWGSGLTLRITQT